MSDRPDTGAREPQPDSVSALGQKASEVRKYAMTRIDSGDYLLPSNDGRGLWRISRYWEDGSASWVDHRGTTHPIRGTFWQIARLRGPLPEGDVLVEDLLDDWEMWEMWETGLLKRKYAVDAALNADARRNGADQKDDRAG